MYIHEWCVPKLKWKSNDMWLKRPIYILKEYIFLLAKNQNKNKTFEICFKKIKELRYTY